MLVKTIKIGRAWMCLQSCKLEVQQKSRMPKVWIKVKLIKISSVTRVFHIAMILANYFRCLHRLKCENKSLQGKQHNTAIVRTIKLFIWSLWCKSHLVTPSVCPLHIPLPILETPLVRSHPTPAAPDSFHNRRETDTLAVVGEVSGIQ